MRCYSLVVLGLIAILPQSGRAQAPSDRHAAWERQIAAENSPDNYCKRQNVAREVIEAVDKLRRHTNTRILDIEHLTTRAYNPDDGTMTCHGVFVTSDHRNIVATFERRKNVAGQLYDRWDPDPSQDLSQFEEPRHVAAPMHPPYPSSSAAAQVAQGEADRRAWETWFRSLSGGMKAGAAWWAGRRSLRNPGSCDHPPAGAASGWAQGCRAAQVHLAPFDARRLGSCLQGWLEQHLGRPRREHW
jgi:hypothetical protein